MQQAGHLSTHLTPASNQWDAAMCPVQADAKRRDADVQGQGPDAHVDAEGLEEGRQDGDDGRCQNHPNGTNCYMKDAKNE
jgi:hypothetical protein